MADATFTAVDLSRLPAPTIIEALDFETIYADALAQFVEMVPDFVARDSDPATKLLQLFAYRELILRQRINDALRGTMVAYAVGADLDNLGALLGVTRLTVTPADSVLNIPAVMESDTDFRRRIVLAPEGYSVAGPEGAYIYHALSAHADVLDASATSPEPGHVLISLLSRNGGGAASVDLINTVYAYLNAEDRRPLTDYVTVMSAQIVDYAIAAEIRTFSGPDGGVVLAAAQAKLADYVTESHRIGRDITRSGIFAALHVEGVQNVTLTSPATDIIVSRTQAPHCTGQTISYAGVGE